MKQSSTHKGPSSSKRVRCAIYTRKSTEEGLEQEFNSLDAQKDAAHAYIRSQRHEGWTCAAEAYDDGGFTGGNLERPALQRLLADIQAGAIDCVIVYKVDRLSRSLLDFARLMEVFDKHGVSFVSVTQQFNTATSMGRLVLNVLLSFAQFEREIISERTRDKIAAARRKGKWSSGMPLFGYDVANAKLVVNQEEAERVRAIFALYLEHQGLLPVVEELRRRGWHSKRWTTRKGKQRGGHPFSKTTLHLLLTNPTYQGKVRYKQEVHPGEHQAIVEPSVWQQVQHLLRANCCAPRQRHASGALLRGLLRCTCCQCAMTPAHCTKNKTTRYRYYVCLRAHKHGQAACPRPRLPAREIEDFVLQRLRDASPEVVADGSDDEEVRLARALTSGQELTTAEQARALHWLVQHIDYEGATGKLTIVFHPDRVTLATNQEVST